MKRSPMPARKTRLRPVSAKRRSEDPAEKAWKLAVALRDGPRCRRCHAGECFDEIHHILGRRSARTRWLVDNGVRLCRDCHRFAHANRKAFLEWVDREFGAGHVDWLLAVRRGAVPGSSGVLASHAAAVTREEA